MNDTNSTQEQVSDTLKDMAEGVLPLAVVTVGAFLIMMMIGEQDGQ